VPLRNQHNLSMINYFEVQSRLWTPRGTPVESRDVRAATGGPPSFHASSIRFAVVTMVHLTVRCSD
jgi:hypothetical protein